MQHKVFHVYICRYDNVRTTFNQLHTHEQYIVGNNEKKSYQILSI